MKLNFKQFIDKSGITQTQLAKELNVSYPTINNLYNNTAKSIYFDKLEELCNLLNCTPNDVLIMDTPKQNKIDSYILSEMNGNLNIETINTLENFEALMKRTNAYLDKFSDDPNSSLTLKYMVIKNENGNDMLVPYFSVDNDKTK